MLNDFLNTLKGKIVGAACVLIVVFLTAKWDSVVETFSTGENIQKQADFNSRMMKSVNNDSVFNALINNPKFIDKMLGHPKVQEFTDNAGMNIRDAIITDVTKKDSTKLNVNAYLSKELGIRDEDFLPLMKNLLEAYKNGDLMTKDQAKAYIEKELRVARF